MILILKPPHIIIVRDENESEVVMMKKMGNPLSRGFKVWKLNPMIVMREGLKDEK